MSTSLDIAATLVAELADLLLEKKWTITTAESCTGGLVAAMLTDRPGSSAWFKQSVVTYSNEAKVNLLGVDEETLRQYGAVSAPVVEAMAHGALLNAGANIAVSISGIAGPDGGTVDKPVGTVWIGWAVEPDAQNPSDASQTGKAFAHGNTCAGAKALSSSYHFEGNRTVVREKALVEALRGSILRASID